MLLKILVFILIFAILNVLREGIMFAKALITGKKNITSWRLAGLGLSLAYIITIIITGFTI